MIELGEIYRFLVDYNITETLSARPGNLFEVVAIYSNGDIKLKGVFTSNEFRCKKEKMKELLTIGAIDLFEKAVKLVGPDSNDGNETCFWCGNKTIKKPLFRFSVDWCGKCGK